MPEYIANQVNQAEHNIQLYNAYDTLLTAEINESLQQLIKDNSLIYNFERALQAPVLEMTLRGIRVDPFLRDQRIKILRADLEKLKSILKAYTEAVWDRPYNEKFPNSTKQLIEFFYGCMKIPPIIMRVKGEEKIPMDRKILERLHLHFEARPIVSVILAHRDITGTLEVLESQIDNDYRMRCSINIASTTTGRFSSSKSTTGSGTNMQNITQDLRDIFIADEGKKIAGIDKEQAESREVGYWCGVNLNDWSYLDAVEAGDIHTYTTRLIWPDLPWTGDLKKDKKIAEMPFYRHFTYREITKRAGHGSNYLGKAYTISQEIHVPRRLIEEFQPKYFNAFPCISRMHHWVAQEIQTKKYLINVFGRRRDFFDRTDSDDTLRAAVAFLFQSATADDMNLGIWRLWKYMGIRIDLLLQLHDAVYFQYSEKDNEEEVISLAQEYLKIELTAPNGRKFSVPSEPKVGWNMRNRFKQDSNGNWVDVNPKGLDKVKWGI